MRGYVGGQHAGVSVGIPGPRGYMNFLVLLVSIPVWIIMALCWLAVYVAPCVWFLMKVMGALLVIILIPIWMPIRGLFRHRRKVKDRKALARVNKRGLQPPQQPRPPQFGSTRGSK